MLFTDFDRGDSLTQLAETAGDRKDTEPLDALGMTVTTLVGTQPILLRLSFA